MWSGDFGEVTAEDVKFSLERVIDPAMKSPYAGDWTGLDHVEVDGPLSGTIVLKDYSATVWTIGLPGWSSLIVCKKEVEALPDRRYTTAIAACSGPYVISEWQQKQRTILTPNPAWTGAAPVWERVTVIPIEDIKASELAFEAGETQFSRISLGTLARYRAEGAPAGAKLLEHPSLAYVWLGMNADNPALSDIRVRQAIQKAVDADAAVEAAYFGVAGRSTGIIAPSLLGHRDIPPSTRDVEGAKKLLEEAGVSGLSLTLDTQNDTQRVALAQVIQASLAEVGIEVTINPLDSAVFNTLGDQTAGERWKDIQLILNRFSMSPDPSFATEWFTPEQVGVWNWERFNSAEFGELHLKAKSERDTATRAEMYRRMQDLMEQSGQYVFLTHELRAYIHSDTVNAALKPDGEPDFRKFTPA
jgi:peptide/nickel transport system substrate-binding protein